MEDRCAYVMRRAEREVKDHGGSAEEPQKHHRKREGNLRQGDEEVGYHGITMLLTTTPETHDGHHDEMFEVYNPRVHLKLFTTDNFLFGQKTGRVAGG